jgi:hypothetical protein
MLRALMNSSGVTWKSAALTFVIALVFYLLAWSWITRRQTGQGPWRVAFGTNAAGVPQLVIAQNSLGLSNITVRFAGESLGTNGTGTVAFGKPKMPVPFGRLAYDDLMFQPGSVALDCFGHVIELLPRNLGLNGESKPWRSGDEFTLGLTNKLSAEARKKFKGGYK